MHGSGREAEKEGAYLESRPRALLATDLGIE